MFFLFQHHHTGRKEVQPSQATASVLSLLFLPPPTFFLASHRDWNSSENVVDKDWRYAFCFSLCFVICFFLSERHFLYGRMGQRGEQHGHMGQRGEQHGRRINCSMGAETISNCSMDAELISNCQKKKSCHCSNLE